MIEKEDKAAIAMKTLKVGVFLFGMVLVGVGVAMAVTNPDQTGYEEYATQKLTQYLRDNTCAKAGDSLEDPCNQLIDQNQAEIKEFITANTERENFGVLSLYKTDLSLSPILPPFVSALVPSYHFETVGVFSSFYTYEAARK
jgi:Domain of unknown function (DUF4359)